MNPSEPAGAPIGALTVASALRLTPLRNARLAAGGRGLQRRIDSVTLLDPGALDALPSATLVLSNADALGQLNLRRLAARLGAAGVSALGVNPDGAWTAAPQDLVAACDARGLPLLVLPAGRVEALVNPVLAAIAERQSERLRRIGELHDALTRAALGNEPMPAIAATVARVLGVPVAVFDEHGGLITGTGRRSIWRPRVLAAETTATPGGGAIEVDGTRYLLAPISTVGRRYGALCAAGAVEDEAFARAALAHAAVVCGMQLVGRQRVEAVHRRFERQLLEELADGSLSPGEARERAERLRLPRDIPYVVMLVARRPRRARGPLDVGGFALDDRTSDAFARALARGTLAARPFPRRQGLGVIVHLTRGHDPRRAARAVRRRLTSARSVPWAASDLAIGVSEPRADITDLPGALREAVLALSTSRRLRAGHTSIEHFGDLGPVRLLASIPDVELAAMAREALGPLGDPGVPGRKDLLATLAALSAHNMRLADAAGDLYFHYNTVRHRLARLRLLLGSRIEDPDGRLSLSLAVAALRIVAVERPDLALGADDAPLSAEPSSAQPRFRRAPSKSRRARSRR
jgi:PucR family transcriptional regulator, purine catabolism regulatory protein